MSTVPSLQSPKTRAIEWDYSTLLAKLAEVDFKDRGPGRCVARVSEQSSMFLDKSTLIRGHVSRDISGGQLVHLPVFIEEAPEVTDSFPASEDERSQTEDDQTQLSNDPIIVQDVQSTNFPTEACRTDPTQAPGQLKTLDSLSEFLKSRGKAHLVRNEAESSVFGQKDSAPRTATTGKFNPTRQQQLEGHGTKVLLHGADQLFHQICWRNTLLVFDPWRVHESSSFLPKFLAVVIRAFLSASTSFGCLTIFSSQVRDLFVGWVTCALADCTGEGDAIFDQSAATLWRGGGHL
eukprot:c40729_g1_i1.p1 GENE.c40729_g1_i1~~c40729_g1_i1.p1  ORF type:complete len:292 (-),score=35.81 c40729_g1_i1:305-1180(-)